MRRSRVADSCAKNAGRRTEFLGIEQDGSMPVGRRSAEVLPSLIKMRAGFATAGFVPFGERANGGYEIGTAFFRELRRNTVGRGRIVDGAENLLQPLAGAAIALDLLGIVKPGKVFDTVAKLFHRLSKSVQLFRTTPGDIVAALSPLALEPVHHCLR